MTHWRICQPLSTLQATSEKLRGSLLLPALLTVLLICQMHLGNRGQVILINAVNKVQQQRHREGWGIDLKEYIEKIQHKAQINYGFD